MTCIAGLVDHGVVYIGGDSAGVSGLTLTVRGDAKVFRRTGPDGEVWLFGFTSSFRMGQIIRYALALPPFAAAEDGDDMVFSTLVRVFMDNLRECLKAGGFARKDSEQESGGTFLVGVRGRLFTVSSDYQVGEALDGYDAVGCGGDIAKGALYATGGTLRPKKRLTIALEAAERLSAGVRAPFVIVDSERR